MEIKNIEEGDDTMKMKNDEYVSYGWGRWIDFKRTNHFLNNLYNMLLVGGRRNFKSWYIRMMRLENLIRQHHPDWDERRIRKHVNNLTTNCHYGMTIENSFFDEASFRVNGTKVFRPDDKLTFDDVIYGFSWYKPPLDNLDWYCAFMKYHNNTNLFPFNNPFHEYGVSCDEYWKRLISCNPFTNIVPYRPFNNTDNVDTNVHKSYKKGK